LAEIWFLQTGSGPARHQQVPVRNPEYPDHAPSPFRDPSTHQLGFKPPPGLVAVRLSAILKGSGRSICYLALSEESASDIAEVFIALFPEVQLVVLPPWDCLPYDRVPPSRHCMGRRMDALRIWNTPSDAPKLMLTSLDAALQRIPPADVIADSNLELVVGEDFDRDAFSDFIQRTGYVEEGIADDPGELAVRDGVIDIYPAGAPGPMRIVISKDDIVRELRGFDRITQRTESYLERVILGPASEAVLSEADTEEIAPKPETMERQLLRLYHDMPTLFAAIGDATVLLAPGGARRVERYLEIVEDARQSQNDIRDRQNKSRSLYLDGTEWEQHAGHVSSLGLDLDEHGELQGGPCDAVPRAELAKLAQHQLRQGLTVVVCGTGKGSDGLCRRVEKATGIAHRSVDTWRAVEQADPGAFLKLPVDLDHGFVDAALNIAMIAVAETVTNLGEQATLLAEPELRIGDVVVHEEHGVGILKDLETVVVGDVGRDAARLEYRDGDSVLVPMEDFGKIWRYSAEPEAVTPDRLHTEAWKKKSGKIAADIRSTARHLLTIAKQRQALPAKKFIPPRKEYSAFTRRFPFAETRDQVEAIKAVLSDLESGKVMNRLICGDVGFGKTEIALRAAAAVALSGGQVAVVAPTTVLARQHYDTFQRRFAQTGIQVGLLSRLLKPNEAKQVKAALSEGEIGVVVATQAILAKNVGFGNLALLIIDEEHRFGLKEKRTMGALAPSLHTLSMSATPIPRTLQSAMIGVQEVSLLTTPPSKRRPVRTSLMEFDATSVRTGLMREYRRGGQSFIVVPRIEDINDVSTVLERTVPELSIKIAHGKMPAAAIDEAIVGFADGDGDVLLATNLIENGLDVPRANTIFVWHAGRFGLAQLHQLRGRVGRGAAQGMATLLTEEGTELAEETHLRLLSLVENDRLGAGLAISLRDLELRGAGDIAGEDQAGHMKVIGTGLYQKLLSEAVATLRKKASVKQQRAILNLDVAGTIPLDYVTDPGTRLNLYAKLLQASSLNEIDELSDEFEDRFGEPPEDVLLLLRTSRLQLVAGWLGIAKLEAGPKASAMTLTAKVPSRVVAAWTKNAGAVQREDRWIFETEGKTGKEQLCFFEKIVSAAQGLGE